VLATEFDAREAGAAASTLDNSPALCFCRLRGMTDPIELDFLRPDQSSEHEAKIAG